MCNECDKAKYATESFVNHQFKQKATIVAEAKTKCKKCGDTIVVRRSRKILSVLAIILCLQQQAFAKPVEGIDVAVQVVLTEAGNQSFEGKIAVAEVFRNRGRRSVGFAGINRKDLGAYLAKQSRSVWADAYRAVSLANGGSQLVKGATLFENIEAFGFPKSWNRSKVRYIKRIGNHTFYTEVR